MGLWSGSSSKPWVKPQYLKKKKNKKTDKKRVAICLYWVRWRIDEYLASEEIFA
jgi:hypothetical protein